MVLEEDPQEIVVIDLLGIEGDLDSLGMSRRARANCLIRGIGGSATCIADPGGNHTGGLPEQFLGTPEATQGKIRSLHHVSKVIGRGKTLETDRFR